MSVRAGRASDGCGGRGEGSEEMQDHTRSAASRKGAATRLVVLAGLVLLALCFAQGAHAGYALQPASGSTVIGDPTFLVHLDPEDSLASIYVSTSAAMSST